MSELVALVMVGGYATLAVLAVRAVLRAPAVTRRRSVRGPGPVR